jgi:hypothetical protein
MSSIIRQRVQMAKDGTNPYVIKKLRSGWLVMGEVQPVEGFTSFCLTQS